MIDYNIIAKSNKFYEEKGFQRVEAPWTVTQSVSQITKPDFKGEDFYLDRKKKILVASGEQSFLYLYLKGFLPTGKFQTTTPCFRDDLFDFTHTKYFLKNELIITGDGASVHNVEIITDNALDFFSKYFDKNDLDVLETKEGFDINYKEYELGSYGYRKCEFLKWVYGTGVAEPRFSNVLNLYKDIK